MNQDPFIFGGLSAMLFGTAILVASPLVLRPGDHARLDPIEMLMRIFGWSLILVGSFIWCVMLSMIGLLLWIAGIVVVSHVIARRRAAQQYSLLWLLTVAAERGLPLGPTVDALAREGYDDFGRRAMGLSELLDQGVPLPEGLQRCPGLLPRDALPLVRVGFDCGVPAAALRRAVSARDVHSAAWVSAAGKMTYVLVMLWFMTGVLSFLALKIVPSFEKIFADFEMKPSLLMQWLVVGMHLVGQWWVLLVLAIGLLGMLVLYALGWYAGWVRWELPGLKWLTRRLHAAAILDALALGVGCRRPLGEVLASLARWYPTRWVRRRLGGVEADAAAGNDWLDALRSRGLLGRADVALLRTAQRAGNLDWALKEMAEANRRRLAYRLQVVGQLTFPPVIVAFGLLVAVVGAAVLSDLATLIWRLV